MPGNKADIIARLQKDILCLQGFKQAPAEAENIIDLGPIDAAFPNHCFPLAAVHEFIAPTEESMAATNGFITALLSSLMNHGGPCIWIAPSVLVFPPALKNFGIDPGRIIFINSKKEKELLWVMEEALKCEGLAAVIGEIKDVSFTVSRRLQLAVEQSRVTGFIIRNLSPGLAINACVSRWRILPMPSSTIDEMPGLGFPRWNIELLRIRNGKPGSWQMEWSQGQFHPVMDMALTILPQQEKRKTG